MRRILAIGGGGFQVENEASPIDDYILQLTGKIKPRIWSEPSQFFPWSSRTYFLRKPAVNQAGAWQRAGRWCV
jgi:hypothetical protein